MIHFILFVLNLISTWFFSSKRGVVLLKDVPPDHLTRYMIEELIFKFCKKTVVESYCMRSLNISGVL